MASIIPSVDEFISKNRSFFEYMKEWGDSLGSADMAKITEEAGGPDKVAVISVDVIEGFCRIGSLASPRVAAIIDPIVKIFTKAHKLGVHHYALPQDTHKADTPEFGAFPPHCQVGTEESEAVREFKELPFFNEMKVMPKNSISSGVDTDLEKWLTNINPNRIIVVGDCTDLCTYQLAMFCRVLANSRGYKWDVILPVNAVDTYDLPVEVAKNIGAIAHPGDFFHAVFLFHMHLNGIKVVTEIR